MSRAVQPTSQKTETLSFQEQDATAILQHPAQPPKILSLHRALSQTFPPQ